MGQKKENEWVAGRGLALDATAVAVAVCSSQSAVRSLQFTVAGAVAVVPAVCSEQVPGLPGSSHNCT